MLLSALRVVHCLPSAMRLEEYILPDAFCPCAKPRGSELLGGPSAMLTASNTSKSRISEVAFPHLVTCMLKAFATVALIQDLSAHQLYLVLRFASVRFGSALVARELI